jgi:hypothetical protein
MTLAEFNRILDEGFKVNHNQGTSELRCFTCGSEAYLPKNKGTTVNCKNNHAMWNVDYIIAYTEMRNNLLNNLLTNNKDMTTNCDL